MILVAVAVLLCASLAFAVMGGDHMTNMGHAALFCCFIIAITLTFFVFAWPQRLLLVGEDAPRVTAPAVTPRVPPWPPDRIELGSLLI